MKLLSGQMSLSKDSLLQSVSILAIKTFARDLKPQQTPTSRCFANKKLVLAPFLFLDSVILFSLFNRFPDFPRPVLPRQKNDEACEGESSGELCEVLGASGPPSVAAASPMVQHTV